MTQSEAIHSIFYRHITSHLCIYLIVYVDDIVIAGDDQEVANSKGITQLIVYVGDRYYSTKTAYVSSLSNQGFGQIKILPSKE